MALSSIAGQSIVRAFVAINGSAPTQEQLEAALQSDNFENYIATLVAGNTQDETAFVTSLYNNLLGTEPDADGLAYWVEMVGSNGKAHVLEAFQYVTLVLGGNFVQAVADANASLDDAGYDWGGKVPTVPTEMRVLTDGRDVITGGADVDVFYADVGQNGNGAVANAFASGDILDGAGGRDRIEATLINDNEVDGANAQISINARTSNLEEVYFGVLDENVVVDAGRMDSVDQFWSDDSDETLVVEDVRLGSKLGVTKDITFGMRDVDQESGLVVSFDSQSLTNSGAIVSNSQIRVQVGDSNQPADSTTPLELIELTLKFTYDGQDYSFDDVTSTDGTYAGLVTALQAALAAEGLSGLVVAQGTALNAITAENDTVPLLYSDAFEITITDPNGLAFENFVSGVGAAPSQQSSNPVSNTSVVDPSTSTTLIESNLILDNAGRGSTAGDAVIGGMSNSNKYVEKLNLIVDRDSKIDDLATASGMENAAVGTGNGNYGGTMVGFDTIELTSTGANGDLSINDIQDTRIFDASSFAGDKLTIGNADELQTLSASISADVTVTANTEAATNLYTTGSGNDVLNVTVDGDDVDTVGEAFTATTSSGNDTVTIAMTAGVSYDSMDELDNLDLNTGSGADNVNLNAYGTFDIDAEGGNDFVRINSVDANGNATTGSWTVGDVSGSVDSYFDARVLYNAKLVVSFAGFEQVVDIQTTAANGFVATQSIVNEAIKTAISTNTELAQLLNVADSTGNQALSITSTVGGLNNLGIAIYQPQLVTGAVSTGENAGQDVQIASGDVGALRQGLIATGVEASSANLEDAAEIKAVTDAAGNWWGSVASNGTADQVLNTTDELTGDVTTGVNVADTTGGIFQDSAASLYYDLGDASGTSGTNSNDGSINLSAINAGDGTDVVVMHSENLAANTLVIDAAFGKTSVVNWHLVASEDVDVAATEMGEHALDFSAFLADRQDTSSAGAGTDNNDSATAITTTVNMVAGASSFGAAVSPGVNNVATAAANSVNVIRFDQNLADNETFENLTAAALVAALNDTANTDATDFGNLNRELLNPDVNANLVGTTQSHIIMVEDDMNEGVYKVFYLTSTLNAGKTATSTVGTGGNNLFDTSAVDLGTLDFGASINFNVVGGTGYTNYITALKDALDSNAATFSYTDAGGNTVNVNLPVSTTYTIAQHGAASPVVTPYVLADSLAAVLADNTGGSDALFNAGRIELTDVANEQITLTGLTNATGGTAGTAIDFTDNAAYVTETQVLAVAAGITDGDAKDFTDADALTVTAATVGNLASVIAQLGGSNDVFAFNGGSETLTEANLASIQGVGASLTAGDVVTVTGVTVAANDFVEAAAIDLLGNNDVITFAGNAATLSAANFTSVFATAGVAATAGDTITVNTLNTATVAGTVADDVFALTTSDTGVTINSFLTADDTVNLGGTNAAVAGTVAELGDGDDNETLVFDTAANLGANAVSIGNGSGTTVNWAVASDTGVIYYDADGDWTAGVVTVGTVNADSLAIADFTVA